MHKNLIYMILLASIAILVSIVVLYSFITDTNMNRLLGPLLLLSLPLFFLYKKAKHLKQ